MTPKEKAKELVDKFYKISIDNKFNTIGKAHNKIVVKECALICVDEIIEALEHHTWQNKDWIRYYKEVKEKINKL
mgnify:CR=1 FL=1|jgi:hypothetical protein